MTEYIFGARQSGKTTELIRRSDETGAYILVANKSTASLIFKQAKMNDYNIPYPITIDDMLSCTVNKSVWSKGILIDELDIILSGLFNGVPIQAVTITQRKITSLSHNTAETSNSLLTVKDVLSVSETRYVYLYVGDVFITKIKPNDALMYLSADVLESSIAKIDAENNTVRITIAEKEE
jgi:hypothetical protein